MYMRTALGAVAIFASLKAPAAEGRQVSGATSAATKAILFYNKAQTYPNAQDSTQAAASGNELKWEIENLTWLDEDTAEQFMEITTTLTAPILATDEVTFHVEFTSSKQSTLVAGSKLTRDGFECKLKKDVSTDYWTTTAKDLYVRPSAADASVDGAVTEDFNNAIANDGKDWIVYTKDEDRSSGDNLCTASSETDIKCEKIKCVIRRQLRNQDPDDMQFQPDDAAANTMTFQKQKSWIMLNQGTYDSTKRKVLEVQSEASITILKGSVLSQVFSYATSVALLASLAFF